MSKYFSFWRVYMLGPVFMAVVGCGSIDYALQKSIQDEARAYTPAVEDGDSIEAQAQQILDSGLEDLPSIAIPDGATLPDYIVIALNRNPTIRRRVREVQVLGFRVPQVTSLEDPMVSVLPPIGDMTETASGMMDGSYGASIVLPFPGRLTARGRVAEQEVRMAFQDLADARVKVASDVARAYYDRCLANVSLHLMSESERLLHQILDVASARYKSGSTGQEEVLRAEVELYSLGVDILTFQEQETSAKTRLNYLMSRDGDAPLPVPSVLDLQSRELELQSLIKKAETTNPQLLKIREKVVRDIAGMKLARLGRYPDLRLGFSYTVIGSGLSPVADGKDTWGTPLGLNLPVWWQRVQAHIYEANARALSALEEYQEIRNMLLFELRDAILKVDSEYQRAQLFRDEIIPRAEQAVQVATANYQSGDMPFTTLVDTWRDWIKFSLGYHRSLVGLEQRFVDLEQVLGTTIADQGEEPPAVTRDVHKISSKEHAS